MHNCLGLRMRRTRNWCIPPWYTLIQVIDTEEIDNNMQKAAGLLPGVLVPFRLANLETSVELVLLSSKEPCLKPGIRLTFRHSLTSLGMPSIAVLLFSILD